MSDSIKHILKSGVNARVNGSLWLQAGDGHFFGPGPVELLERIEKSGSLRMAAKEMNMSYKKAWDLINTLNHHTAAPLVIPKIGGKKGGGSTITDEAREMIAYHKRMRKRFAEFLKQETELLKS